MGSTENGVDNGANGTNGTNGSPKPVVELSVALAPNDFPAVPGLVKEITSLASSTSAGDDDARLALVEKARSLVRALETPRETMIKHNWAQVRPFRGTAFCPCNC